MSAALSCTGRYAKEKEAGGLRGQWAKGEGPSGSTMQTLSGDISDLSLKFFFCFFLSGQSVTIKLLLIRIIRGRRLFFRGGIFVVGKKKNPKTSEFLHRLFLSVRRRLTSSTRAEPGEHHIHCGEQMEFKKTVVKLVGRLQLPLQRGSNLGGGGGLSHRQRMAPSNGKAACLKAEFTVWS